MSIGATKHNEMLSVPPWPSGPKDVIRDETSSSDIYCDWDGRQWTVTISTVHCYTAPEESAFQVPDCDDLRSLTAQQILRLIASISRDSYNDIWMMLANSHRIQIEVCGEIGMMLQPKDYPVNVQAIWLDGIEPPDEPEIEGPAPGMGM